MIIGGSKKDVIENIKKNVLENELNKKGELDDPIVNDDDVVASIEKFFENKKKPGYKSKNAIAMGIVKKLSGDVYKNIELDGLENIESLDLSKGAILTSNHFNPLDSYNMRYLVEKKLKKKMYIVIQGTNLSMPDKLGFLMNNLDVIPIIKSPNYIINTFIPEMKRVLDEGNIVLIYPEEEMWFNYRKPRPCKRGAYLFAAELNVPIISTFVEMIDLNEDDNDEFLQVANKVHVLKPIIPNAKLSSRENSIKLSKIDYEQKCKKYEEVYNKKLEYDFQYEDIAGYKLKK